MLARDYKMPKKEAEHLHVLTDSEMQRIEDSIKREITLLVKETAVFLWFQQVKGIGPVLSAGLVSGIQSVSSEERNFGTVSKLWKYCGMATEQVCKECKKPIPENKEAYIEYAIKRFKEFKKKPTKKEVEAKRKTIETHLCKCNTPTLITVAQRKRTGLPLSYSPFMKVLCWKVGEQFNKLINNKDAYYAQWLMRFKAEEKKKNPKMTKGHIHNRAKRKAVKLFLSHLWDVWRQIEGAPHEKSYYERKTGHTPEPPPHTEFIETIRRTTGKKP